MANEVGGSGGIAEGGGGLRTGINIVSILSALFGLFGGGVNKPTKRALEGMRAVVVDLGNELARYATENDGILGRIVGVFRRGWIDAILPFIRKVDGGIARIFKWLRDTFGPVIEFLIWVRRELLKFYDKWFRPIFDTITVIRRILQLGSFLGIEAAGALDRKLAELERRIRIPLDFVVNKLNEVIGVVDRIVTLDGFLQRYTLVRSLVLYQRDALKVWWASIHKPMSAEKKKEYEAPATVRSIQAVADDLTAYVRDRGGPDRARIDEHALDLEQRLRAA
jgi:hypothetical protein